MEKEKEEFKPFVPAEKEMKEFSITAVIVGVLLAVVFGATNAYLGLRVGIVLVSAVKNNFLLQQLCHFIVIRPPKFIPLCKKQHCIGF